MKVDKYHNQQKGLIVREDSGGRKMVLRCHHCGSYLGESNKQGEIAGVIYCRSCKGRTEVVRSSR